MLTIARRAHLSPFVVYYVCVVSISSLTETARVVGQQLADAKEQAQVYRRRLAATGDNGDGLDGLGGGGGSGVVGGTSPIPEYGTMMPRGSKVGAMMSINGDGSEQGSLSSEIADFDRGDALNRVAAQQEQIEQLKRQLAALQANLGQKEREVERLHGELETAQGGQADGKAVLGNGPASDGDDLQSKGCCAGCSIM